MKLFTRTLFAAILAAAAAASAHASPALDAAELNCAAEDMQLFYYYLDPGNADVKERKTACHGAEQTLKMPDWLAAALPVMQERKVWKDPEEGKLSETEVWRTPVSILYEFAHTTQKIRTATAEELLVTPFAMESDYADIRARLALSVDRVTRAKLGSSFDGRGKGLLSTLNQAIEQVDKVSGNIAARDEEGFYNSAANVLKLSRELFAQLFAPPSDAKEYKYSYVAKPVIMPGYRAVSLPVPGFQTLFQNPGERIDLLVTFEAVMDDDRKEMVTATILQDIVVINVSKPDSMDGPGVVQLMCNPNEAQYAALSLAQSKRINVTRRAAGDTEMHPMEIASFKKLFR